MRTLAAFFAYFLARCGSADPEPPASVLWPGAFLRRERGTLGGSARGKKESRTSPENKGRKSAAKAAAALGTGPRDRAAVTPPKPPRLKDRGK